MQSPTPDRLPLVSQIPSRRFTIPGRWAVALAALLVFAGLAYGAAAWLQPAGQARGPAAQDIFSVSGLASVRASLGPGGLRVIQRLEARGREIDPYRPSGWTLFDLDNVPTLGFGGLDTDDARLINAAIPRSSLPVEFGRPFTSADLGSPSGRRALNCLTQAVYFEAGRDSEAAQAAVAQVVLNRVRHPAYPNSVCGVVYQGALRVTGCQFSFTCDGSLQRGVLPSAWTRAQSVARRALLGFVARDVGVATNYHADYVLPYWARTLVKISQVGPHIFYRWTGPLGQRRALNQVYSGDETNIARSVLAAWDERTQGVDAAVELRQSAGRTAMATAVGALKAAGLIANVQDGQVHALLNPMARQPTPEEVKAINAKLAEFEKTLDAETPSPIADPPAATPATPAAAAPVP